MRASHLSLVPTDDRNPLHVEPRASGLHGAAAFLERLDAVMKEAREIVDAPEQPAELRAICGDFVRRNADAGEGLRKVTWLALPRGRAEDDVELQLEPFIGA
jgi:hypothetical protein